MRRSGDSDSMRTKMMVLAKSDSKALNWQNGNKRGGCHGHRQRSQATIGQQDIWLPLTNLIHNKYQVYLYFARGSRHPSTVTQSFVDQFEGYRLASRLHTYMLKAKNS